MNKAISKYMAELGRKGGAKSKRTWTEEQKKDMVAKKAATLQKKKELLKITGGENGSISEGE